MEISTFSYKLYTVEYILQEVFLRMSEWFLVQNLSQLSKVILKYDLLGFYL